MSASQIPVDVSRETADRLSVLTDLIHRWDRTVPLLSQTDRRSRIGDHVLDSLSLVPHLGKAMTTADLGSGAGFPGLVLAIATGRRMTLIESNRRKAAFLLEAARLTQAPVTVHAGRIEAMHATFGLIVARAVAPLDGLLPLVAPRLAETGRCLLLKGRRLDEELEIAGRHWSFRAECYPGLASRGSTILCLTNLRPKGGP